MANNFLKYFNKDGLQGIYMQWEFDPMFSSQLIYNYDTDNNMIFSKSETADLKSKYFDMLVEGGYYTEIQIDSKKMKNPLPVSFKATIDKEDEILIMSFFVPLSIPYSSSTSMYYSVSDSTSYTSFFIPQKDLRLKGSDYKILKKHINQFGEISYTFTKQ
ncbi:MAG: hypothetical protein B6229_10540 [Spirochaetaceae bacterium 4572_7]|nr:MAG: hypothetical protein B6229_10540 [Spirochaetaceae bacterium 4572_7]